MKGSRLNYFAVGLFVIAAVVGLVVSVAVLSGRTGATEGYYAVYRNVTGVKFGTQVMYEGYPVGQVETVTPIPEAGGMSFRVNFAVRQGWRIPEDSIATIAAPGLLSAITISIQAGKSANALKPGGQVKSQEAANIFAMVSSVAGDLGVLAEQNVKPLLANLNQIAAEILAILDKDGKNLVRNAAAMVEDINARIPVIAGNVQEFAERMRKNSEEISELLSPENREKLDRTIANLDQATQNLEQLAAISRGVIADNRGDIRYVVESMTRHVETINQNLEGASRNMLEFTRQIRQNPGLLMGGTPPKDTAPVR
jgi:phospholipid/cholesterol/gamma-HCH transport system substrate-binding protein